MPSGARSKTQTRKARQRKQASMSARARGEKGTRPAAPGPVPERGCEGRGVEVCGSACGRGWRR
eukprot:533723-Rhodomonas_salina.1